MFAVVASLWRRSNWYILLHGIGESSQQSTKVEPLHDEFDGIEWLATKSPRCAWNRTGDNSFFFTLMHVDIEFIYHAFGAHPGCDPIYPSYGSVSI
jgi:hypothetical protein